MSVISRPAARTNPDAHFHGRWLPAARGLWMAVALVQAGLFLLNLLAPAFGGKPSLCPFRSACGYAPLTRQALHHAHISPAAFDAYLVTLSLLDALITIGLGCLIFWRKSDQPSSWLASLVLLLMGGSLLVGDDNAMVLGVQNIGSTVLVFGALLAIGFFIATFPDGRLVPRWSWLAGSSLFIQGFLYQLPGPWYLERWPAPLLILETLLAFGSPVFVQIYRFVRVSTPAQRRQTKWVIYTLACLVLLEVAQTLAEALFPSLNRPASLYPLVSYSLIPSVSALLIPIGISIAILRSQLWDIDVLINRTLVYGSLTASLAVIYVAGVLSLQALFRTLANPSSDLAVAISTLAIAALFHPLRRRIQSFIDRRFYRRKYDAARTLTAFRARLRNEVNLDELRGDLLSVVHETMQPSHVSLWLRGER